MRIATKESLFAVLVIAAAIASVAVPATADERAADKPPAAYSVWTANCSRSLQMSATCDSLGDAFSKAGELRAEMSNDVKAHDYVIVVAGEPKWDQMLALFQHLSAGSELKQPCQFEVYRSGCRFGWRKVDLGTDVDLAKAEAMVKADTAFRGLQLVYNLSPADAS
ncbi:MAG: hypothetical protein K2Y37_12455 [Pirellulales bacterium]|nr:hypothetical protein [Pirellulales bacterium]